MIDDSIRDAIHELVAAAPDPRPLPAAVRPGGARRWLAAAAAVALVGGAITAAILLRRSDDGTIMTGPDTTTDTTATTATTTEPTTEPTATTATTPPSAGPRFASSAFTSTGSAEEICTAAGIEAGGSAGFAGVVLHDETGIVDGVDTRWLVCTGEEGSGWGVTALVSTDSVDWQLGVLGLGGFNHAGDRVDVEIDGPVATIRYESLVFESADGTAATTTDGGRSWTITGTAERARDATVAALVERGYRNIGGDHDVLGSATFGVESATGEVITGHVLLGQSEPIGDLSVTGTTTVAEREALVLDDRAVFVTCGDLGITIAADELDPAREVMAIALARLAAELDRHDC